MSEVSVPPPRRLHLRLPIGAWVALAIASVVGAGWILGLSASILVLAGLALAGAVFLGYSSLLALAGDAELSLDEALTLVAPSAEEEQKRAVLRALKDLEYERAVGKISAADYDELVARYRADAKRLLQRVAEIRGEQLARAEQRAAERLAAAGLVSSTAPARAAEPTASDPPLPPAAVAAPGPRPRRARARGERSRCPSCGRRASRDARFCAACGAAIRPGAAKSSGETER
jgi:hypothetical protein